MQGLADGGLPHFDAECVGSIPTPAPIIAYHMEQKETIESRVASAILEKPIGEIEVGGKTYKIAPPSIGTLILISEIIATLPIVKDAPKDQQLSVVLHYAKDYRKLGEIGAILILGANGLTEETTKKVEVVHKSFFGLIERKEIKEVPVLIDRKAELADAIIKTVSAKTLYDTIVHRLSDLEIGYFFSITTSLSEANLIKPTKEVG